MGLGKESMGWGSSPWQNSYQDNSNPWLYILWGILISIGLLVFFNAL